MFFSRQLSLSSLIELCRMLRHGLGAGLPIVEVFRRHSERGHSGLSALTGRLALRLQKGEGLADAMAREKNVLPPLLRAMADAGEQTGNLPEVFHQLEKYYLLQQKLVRQFRSRFFFQFVQLGFAFLVIAVVLFILGTVASSRGGDGPGVFGVQGPGAGILFLVLSFGTVALLFMAFVGLKRLLRRQVWANRLVLGLPALGTCLEALALGRFALALRLTLDSHLPIVRALRLSLAATGSAVFVSRTDEVVAEIKEGNTVFEALTRARLFPAAFLEMVAIGEESGQLPETMMHQCEYYQEEADRRLATLTKVATGLVWLIYAAFMVSAIFILYSIYFGALRQALGR